MILSETVRRGSKRKSNMDMNILHVTFDMRIGGTEMVIKSIVESHASSDFTMSIFCIEAPTGPWGVELANNGIAVTTHNRTPGFDKSLITALRKHIKQHNIHVLHCHQYTPWVYGTLAALGLNCKVLFTEHGRFYPDSTTWKRKWVNPILAFFTDGFTAISDATRDALATYEFINKKKIELVYNGIKPLLKTDGAEVLKTELGIANDSLVLGTIARFDPIKNHTMMLEAFSIALKHTPNLMLVIVGDGDERHTIEQKIEELNLSQHVILTGYQVNPTRYLQIMDMFLLSSLSEGTSMTLLEAMSLSKPCVVTNAGGNPEIIKHEYNGLVTTNGNPEHFADGIIKMLSKPTINTFGRNGKKRFNEHFSDNLMVAQYTRIYRAILGTDKN